MCEVCAKIADEMYDDAPSGPGWDGGGTSVGWQDACSRIAERIRVVPAPEIPPLVLAAPDLLAALKFITEPQPYSATQEWRDNIKKAREMATAAIAKAEGGT